MKSFPTRQLAIVSGLLGAILFAWIVRRTGFDEILQRISQLGSGFLIILLLSFLRHLVRAFSWLRCLPPESRGAAGIGRLLRARLAGEALGDLTFGPVVAEPMRLLVFSEDLPAGRGLSSLAVENIAYAFSSALMVVAGAVAVLATLGLQESIRAAILVALGLTTAIAVGSFVVIAGRIHIASALLTRLASLLVRDSGRSSAIASKLGKLRDLEDYVFDFYARRPIDLLLVAASQIIFHLAGVAEILLTLRLMGSELSPATAFLLESINRAINIAFTFVPGLVGVDEAGTSIMTSMLGLGAASGVALAIVRKIRMFFWIAVGLAVLILGRRAK